MKNPQNLPLHVRLIDLANSIVLDDIDVDHDPVPNLTLAVDAAEATIQAGLEEMGNVS